ncbi:UvrD-helicase domain-containing protein [Gordonia sp. (in: high G+C Gram-positive bacteria)]|uniref:UvrD-helicase domain-containing protein n=1 Tax=Gordonia sp. (in: high G+C Gram-positive bacteria) TaxID=84139 RepID=UPI0026109A86|nr:UvrD-helicase domain-containing protein [Gordonia sp. (in: high G+C Gram-positive bacteria)]
MTEPSSAVRRVSARSLAAALGLPSPTDEQVEVIEAPLEPMLVVAGAGAGKTETMASRVVWLVANRLVAPDEILGLTFTRKAASELGARIRRRLSMLAGSPALLDWDPGGDLAAVLRSADAEVSTYHAYAGRLIADYGLLLPVEPSSTLLSETELWQLAFSVVTAWPHELATTKVPSSVTEAVLNLYSEMAEHLVDDDALAAAGGDLYSLIDTLPKGPRQRAEPSKALRAIQDVIDERRALLPLVQALRAKMTEQGALDFGSQMSLAARLVTTHPEVVAAERAGIKAVLLDEYQDTGHSQRLLLSALFGGTRNAPLAVTAVGDPIQSIYGWRGASAANLPRFAMDFPRPDGAGSWAGAHRRELLTSWRNCRGTLYLANEVSAQLRARGVPVNTLRPRDDAPEGAVRLALTETVDDERAWLAGHVEDAYRAAERDGRARPTVAILVRRNEDSAPLAAVLEARGIPVEVVGIGGLLHVPEITDIVATLTLMADPMAGTAAMRLLTGARWQLGAADLAALWRRARELAAGAADPVTGVVATRAELDAALESALPAESVDAAGIGDALVDPGDRDRYTAAGYQRIRAFGRELERLRRRIGQPLPELVADVEQTIGVAVEAQIRARRMRGAITGREHLDAFAEYVAAYAERPGATLPGLLAFLDTAESVEKGLEAGQVEVAEERVQILTVHASKGLEWDIVVVPHLAKGIFPSAKADTTWLGSARELPAPLRGDLASGDGDEGFPPLPLGAVGDRKELEETITAHKEAIKQRRLDEDRRLLYVALTRAKQTLLVSAHHWSATGDKPRGGSEFFTELAELVRAAGSPGLVIDVDAPPPPEGAENPMTLEPVTAPWPVDRLGERRPALRAAAAAVEQARADRALVPIDPPDTDDPEVAAWRAEVAALLDERRRTGAAEVGVELPGQLSVSQLVELGTDEQAFAARLRRPVPFRPNPMARRGTAFHAWVERRFGATRLLDLDELPGAADESAVDDDLEVLRAAFLASPWADRTPLEVEVGFETVIGSTVVRGRMDAVFADRRAAGGEEGYLVVDWKTGAVPEPAKRPALELQLAAYRVAWARLRGVDVDRVRAAFVYVRHHFTLEPENLPDADELAELLAVGQAPIE